MINTVPLRLSGEANAMGQKNHVAPEPNNGRDFSQARRDPTGTAQARRDRNRASQAWGKKTTWRRDRTAEQRSHKHAGTQLGPHKHAGTETEPHKHAGIITLPSSPRLTQEVAILLTEGAVLGRGPDGQEKAILFTKSARL